MADDPHDQVTPDFARRAEKYDEHWQDYMDEKRNPRPYGTGFTIGMIVSVGAWLLLIGWWLLS